jgi:peptidyl-tRNA hydrolase, PTH1 family
LLFIGLGNPGVDYHETRHNAGFMVVDKIASDLFLKFKKPFFKNYYIASGFYKNEEIILIKPLTYMNRSGLVLNSIPKKYFNTENPMIVICDNMDLSYGECRIKARGSNSGHNGMSSIIQNYGSEDFLRIYVGISRPVSGDSVISHVLGKIDDSEYPNFIEGIGRACDASVSLLTTSVQRVMNEYNRRNT